jgi:hypothetical protein
MKTSNAFLTLLILVIICSGVHGTIWTVDSNPGNHAANFTSIQAAHDAAADGDTIYISGFNVSYGNTTVTKKLYIFGPGYFLNENDSTQANTYPARIEQWVAFNAGSENSVIAGCYMNADYISTDSITVKRNRISGYGGWSIYIQNSADFVVIKQNYISSGLNGISLHQNHNNVNITNNFINTGSLNYSCIAGTVSSSNIIVENNVLYGGLTIYNAEISNNIYRDGTYTGDASNTIVNNICNATQFSATGNNQQNVVMSTVFISSGTTDGQWQIDPAGPAAGAGTFGADIGMFGGITPYILSGIPEIPAIYSFYGPSNASQTLQIQAKIKSRR